MKKTAILPRAFYDRDTHIVAQELLGKVIIRTINDVTLSGRIVETEAYTFDDPACHAAKGKTKSNAALFGTVGHAYIYFIYGNHYCLNFVARDAQTCAGGVLIRALEPIDGIVQMQKYRNMENVHMLTNGPGKLAQALHITKALYGVDVTQVGDLYVCNAPRVNAEAIAAVPRIGISKAQEKLWRYYIKDNPFVSKK